MRAVAAGDVERVAGFLRSVGACQRRAHGVFAIRERYELCRSFDRDAALRERVDQKALVLVLREGEHIRKGTQPTPHVAERDATHLSTSDPEIGGGELQSALHDVVGQSNLAIQLECARLNRDRAGRRTRLRDLVDDAHTYAESLEKERED